MTYVCNKIAQIYLPMNSYATIMANNQIDLILDKGAQRLYNKYLEQKLPQHTSEQNKTLMHSNFKLHSIQQPQTATLQIVGTKTLRSGPRDNLLPGSVNRVRHHFNEHFSTLSPKNTTIDRSTKYGTIIQSEHSNVRGNSLNVRDVNDSLLAPQQDNSPIFKRKQRPSTMQGGRLQVNDPTQIHVESKLQKVEEKRAVTCHSRKRKPVGEVQKSKQKLVKLKEEPLNSFKQQIQSFNRLRRYRKQKLAEEAVRQVERLSMEAAIRVKQLRVKQHYNEMRQSLNEKAKVEVPITNVEILGGSITINGQVAKPKTSIIQLQFNPENTITLSTIEPKVVGVNGVKKYSFLSTKIRTKNLMTNEQFTNSGKQQISSIPFVTLNYGITLSENGLAVSATRRSKDSNRQKYEMQNSNNRFKSHLAMVNSARVSNQALREAMNISTARSLFIEGNREQVQQKLMETTLETNREMQESILWRPRARSQNKSIRISNRQILKRQILEAKLCQE